MYSTRQYVVNVLKIQQKHEIKISSDLYEAVILDPILLGKKTHAIKINAYGKDILMLVKRPILQNNSSNGSWPNKGCICLYFYLGDYF